VGFQREAVARNAQSFATAYNCEVVRYEEIGRPEDTDTFAAGGSLLWSRNLKRHLAARDAWRLIRTAWFQVHTVHILGNSSISLPS